MTNEDVKRIVSSYLQSSMNGMSVENSKFDFKRQWYKLTDPQGINPFIKDVTAIANTFGPDGCIVIGFDDKTKEFHPSYFTDCGLKDPSQISGLISKYVDPIFTVNVFDTIIDGNIISLIHIPPSIDKPHVIRNHKTFNNKGEVKKEEINRIFVRKNTEVYEATKNDLELMYYDRKNIILEYDLSGYIYQSLFDDQIESRFEDTPPMHKSLIISPNITIENSGRRPIAVSKMGFSVSFNEDGEKYLFFTHSLMFGNIIISPGGIWTGNVKFFWADADASKFKSDFEDVEGLIRGRFERLVFSPLQIVLVNGRKIICSLNKYI